jgi:hypothetical protein
MCLTTRWPSKMPLPPSMASSRHRFADIRDTRNRRAASRSLAPASTSSAAASRTPLAASPFCGGQPAATGVPHGSGIARCAGRHQSE